MEAPAEVSSLGVQPSGHEALRFAPRRWVDRESNVAVFVKTVLGSHFGVGEFTTHVSL